MPRAYSYGLDILGAVRTAPVANPASDYGTDYGPLSPDQLAQLDRKLTPVEQAAVDASQGKAADDMLVAQRAKGGPQSATVSVTPQGAVIKSLAPIAVPGPKHLAWWQIALLAASASAVGYGIYKVLQPTMGGRVSSQGAR